MKKLYWKYYFACPSCGNDKKFFRPREQSSAGTGCLIFILGGLLPFLIFAGNRGERIQCAKCGFVFRRPAMPNSPVATLALWIILLVIFAAIIGFIAEVSPSFFTSFPGSKYAPKFQRFVETHSRGITAYMVSGIALLFGSAIFTCIISNWRYHRRLRSLYYTRALKFDPTEFSKDSSQTEGSSSNSKQEIT